MKAKVSARARFFADLKRRLLTLTHDEREALIRTVKRTQARRRPKAKS